MSPRVEWGRAAEWALRAMPWQDAARVSAAVYRYAESGTGAYRRPIDHTMTRRLRVGVYRIVMALDRSKNEVWVLAVYRAEL